MKRFSLTCLILLAWALLHAQGDLTPTQFFTIEGAVQSPLTIDIAQLLGQPQVKLKPVQIVNHLGVQQSLLKDLRGVRLQPLLAQATLNEENSKYWSEFYYVFEASDGYQIVFSWNEVFNTATGDQIYLIVQRDGKTLPDLDGQLAVLVPSDKITGRRYLKGLAKVKVMRAE